MKPKLNRAARRALVYGTNPIVSKGCTLTMPDGSVLAGTLFARHDPSLDFEPFMPGASIRLAASKPEASAVDEDTCTIPLNWAHQGLVEREAHLTAVLRPLNDAIEAHNAANADDWARFIDVFGHPARYLPKVGSK
jgi:hypothetical protein